MRIVDLIEKKKQGKRHTREEIEFLIKSLMDETVADYQISAWLMAVYFQGMDIEETTDLTRAMINSGETLNLSNIADNIVDKHSTGGVGDKITLILIPILQALGVPIVKLSGRGLGFTGGTIDKLESIPGFNCSLPMDKILQQVREIGAAIACQTNKLAPADGKLYALRDVTATVDSMPLIASSVVSKKIASGANNIILDVKYGAGAFMKTAEQARELSELMVAVGKNLGKNITAVVSCMDEPLGRAVGNALEVLETIEFLKGNTVGDLREVTYKLASIALLQTGNAKDEAEAVAKIDEVINNGKACEALKKIIAAQDGESMVVNNYALLPKSERRAVVKAYSNGIVQHIDALKTAYASKIVGAGREKKTDSIDYSAGIYLNKKSGEYVSAGETLATIFYNCVTDSVLDEAKRALSEAYTIDEKEAQINNLICAVVD